MKSEIQNEIKIKLEMNEKEASFLKSLVQNPTCPPENEPGEYKIMRKKFWEALKDIDTY